MEFKTSETTDDESLSSSQASTTQQPILTLQQSFALFLKTKKEERKLEKQIATTTAALRSQKLVRDEEYKQQLRQKFIAQAKSYLGVPYGKKYQPEGSPEYPLYLDCCGLVRQVVKDLQHEFGFVIGKWNQAYQFDTLPIRYAEVSQMKPGDLVFYSGEYSSKRSFPLPPSPLHLTP
jgi:cell wall-associated NlpC family hydrolase